MTHQTAKAGVETRRTIRVLIVEDSETDAFILERVVAECLFTANGWILRTPWLQL
jgi:hypothetical protein